MPPWLKALDRLRRGKTVPQQRLSAWAWRRRAPAPSSGDPMVIFAIPLISARRAPDWAGVQANLARTLAALTAQTDPHWAALVCGQDEPVGLPADGRVTFVRSTVSDKFYDKGDKRLQLIAEAARRFAGRDGYYVQCDADDILHPDFVAHVRATDNGRGYLVDRGYFVDASTGRLAPLAPPEAPFWRSCGTSSAVRFDFRDDRRRWVRLLRKQTSHTQVPAIMALHGLPLDPVPFPAALYVVGHGQNMIQRRGKLAERLAYLDGREIDDPAARAAILSEFGFTLP